MRDRLNDLKDGAKEPLNNPEPAPAAKTKAKKEKDIEKGDQESDAMKGFFDQLSSIKDSIAAVKSQIEQIEAIHQQALNTISEEQSSEKAKELERLMDRTNKSATEIRNKLKAIETENKKLQSSGADQSDVRIRISQHSTITKKFLDVMMEYKDIQKKYQDKYKQRMQRQLLIVNPTATEEEITKLMDTSDGTAVFSKQMLATNQKAEAKRALKDIQERHADIIKIERSIIELHQLFMDMSVLVQAQGEMLNQIDVQVSNAAEDMNKGVDALKGAVKYQKRSRKKMCILLVCLAIVVVIVGGLIGGLKGGGVF